MLGTKIRRLLNLYFGFSLLLISTQIPAGKCTLPSICCRGWSDDVAGSNVDTKECIGMCWAETSCTDSTNKDCATNWECNDGGSLKNETDADCLKPEAGKQCACTSSWCNCPASWKNKDPPSRQKKLICCAGDNKNPKGVEVYECDRDYHECLGSPGGASGETNLFCGDSSNARLRENCYDFSFKAYGTRSTVCRCTTDYCNCPADIQKQKPEPGTGGNGNVNGTGPGNSTKNPNGAHEPISSYSFKIQLALFSLVLYMFKM